MTDPMRRYSRSTVMLQGVHRGYFTNEEEKPRYRGEACRPKVLPEQQQVNLAAIAVTTASRSVILSRVAAFLVGMVLTFQVALVITRPVATPPQPPVPRPIFKTPNPKQENRNIEARFAQINFVLDYLIRNAKKQRPQERDVMTTQAELPRPFPEAQIRVAVVTTSKANLRFGPGKTYSPAMAVSEGTRLVIEKSVGNWHMVIAPSGERLWAATEVLGLAKTSSGNTPLN